MIPKHIGLIIDGNGRWAEAHGLPRKEGYKAGLLTLTRAILTFMNLGVEVLSVYAFSTENWKRNDEEVEAIFEAVAAFCSNPVKNCAINFSGNLEILPDKYKTVFKEAMKKRNCDDKIILNVALNYGGRADIVNAANRILQTSTIKTVDEKTFLSYLSTSDLPPLDAIVRTGGEKRLSNFMLFESAYSELVFVDALWPDFDNAEIDKVMYELQKRKQKFGGEG